MNRQRCWRGRTGYGDHGLVVGLRGYAVARPSWVLSVVVLLMSIVLMGADQPVPPPGSVRLVEDLGPVRWEHRILGRDGGFSARWKGDSIWVFGDTIMSVPGADGDRWADNSSAVTSDLDAADGVSLVPPKAVEHLDGARLPGEYLPLSAWERSYNAGHADQYFLWPGPVVPDPRRGRILFFFTAGRRAGTLAGFQEWGTGLVAWDAATERTVRPAQGPGVGSPAGDQWTMFGPGETRYGTMAFTVGQTLYAYGCDRSYGFVFACRLARVRLADAFHREAWRFFAGGGRWSSDAADAVRVLDAGHAGTVFYNRHLRRYLAVYGFTTATYRTAPHPWGPWSKPVPMFRTLPPVKDYNYFVLAHPEYGDGRILYVTYSRPTEVGWEVRLARVTLR